MSESLTPDQLAELVVTAKRAQRDNAAHGGRRTRRVRPLDFSRPMKLSPPEVRRFENTHTRFCRDASVRLSSELRSTIELEVLDVVQLTWASAMREVRTPSILATATVEPGGGEVLLCMEEPLLLVMVERLLGGAPTELPAPRNLTDIDSALARRAFESLIESISGAWHEFIGLQLTLASLEPQQANVELVAPSEPTIVVTVEGRDQTGNSAISLLVPYSALAGSRLTGKAASGEESAREDGEGETMRTALGGVGVELRAEVAAIELPLGEVLRIAEGDVLRLGPVGGEGVFGGGERLHRVRPGRAAVQIIGAAEER